MADVEQLHPRLIAPTAGALVIVHAKQETRMSISYQAATDAADLRRRTSPILLSSDGRIAGSSLAISAQRMRALRARPLAELGLSQRAVNGARDAGLRIIGDIVDLSERELCTVRGFGPASLRALRSAILWLGIKPMADQSICLPPPADLASRSALSLGIF